MQIFDLSSIILTTFNVFFDDTLWCLHLFPVYVSQFFYPDVTSGSLPITVVYYPHECMIVRKSPFLYSFVHNFRLSIILFMEPGFRNSQNMVHYSIPTLKHETLSVHLSDLSTLCSYIWFCLDPEFMSICLSHAFVFYTWVTSYQISRLKSYSVPKYDLVVSVSSLYFYCNQMIPLIRNCSRSTSNRYFN